MPSCAADAMSLRHDHTAMPKGSSESPKDSIFWRSADMRTKDAHKQKQILKLGHRFRYNAPDSEQIDTFSRHRAADPYPCAPATLAPSHDTTRTQWHAL